jgi:hypothetical protein
VADLAEQLSRMKIALQLSGEHNEGTTGGQGTVFSPSDTYESFTWPKEVVLNDNEGEGTIIYPYDGMVRHKHYIATVESSTDDNNFSGTIVAKYIISRKGTIGITDIQMQPEQQRDSGKSIIDRIRAINGSTI